MATNKNEYVITIKNDTDSGKSKNPIAGSNAKGKTSSKNKNEKSDAQNLVKGIVAFKKDISPVITSVVSYATSTLSITTGSSELQAQVDFAVGALSNVSKIGTSIATGFAIGNVAGAVIGAATSIFTTVMSIATSQNVLNKQADSENVSLGLLSTRAGANYASYNGSRT